MLALRQVRPEDLQALYAISLATGHEGGDASHLHGDGRLIGHIYSAPYALLDPALVLVAVDAAGACGFAAGALDTAAWEDRLEREWWPALRRRYADPGLVPMPSWTADQRRAFMIHHPARTPPAVADGYPAHLHLNLLPRAQGRGLGPRLLAGWLDLAAPRGTAALHVAVNRANARAVGFWERQGFAALEGPPAGRTLWMGRG